MTDLGIFFIIATIAVIFFGVWFIVSETRKHPKHH